MVGLIVPLRLLFLLRFQIEPSECLAILALFFAFNLSKGAFVECEMFGFRVWLAPRLRVGERGLEAKLVVASRIAVSQVNHRFILSGSGEDLLHRHQARSAQLDRLSARLQILARGSGPFGDDAAAFRADRLWQRRVAWLGWSCGCGLLLQIEYPGQFRLGHQPRLDTSQKDRKIAGH